MNKITTALALASLASGFTTAHANSVVISGTINKVTDTAGVNLGTSFDAWKINMQVAGAFTVDTLAFEANLGNIASAGFVTSDLNADGELTWLDTYTSFYTNTGTTLVAADAIVSMDDTGSSASYHAPVTAATSPITLLSRAHTNILDGSLRSMDSWYDATAVAGSYTFLVADYSLTPAEAAGGYNGFGGTADTFGPPTGYVNPITDHADYQVKFSSKTLNFAVDTATKTITVTAASPLVREDSDGDHISDLFWRKSSNGLNATLHLNGLSAPATIAGAGEIVPGYEVIGRGDYNGDGKSDLLWADASKAVNAAYLQLSTASANASAATPVPIVTSCTLPIAGDGDYNSDGKADILLLNNAGVSDVLMMNGSTPITTACATIPLFDVGTVIKGTGDYNGDNKADILYSNSTNTVTRILYTDGGLKTLPVSAAAPTQEVNKNDLLATAGSASVGNISSGDLAASEALAVVGYDVKGSGRYNTDNTDDVLLLSIAAPHTLLLLDGATHNTSTLVSGIPAGWDIKGTGDYDNNGFADVLFRHSTSGGNYLMLINSGSISAQNFIPTFPYIDPALGYAIAYPKTQN